MLATSDAPDALPRPGSGAMFDRIADRYDRLNRILSLGLDRGWRRAAVRSLALTPRSRVLDVATGTADLAIALARSGPEVAVVGLDPSPRMLAVGERKVAAAGLAARIRLVPGDAERLPFGDDEFDGVTIAFGIRNVPDRPRALREMARVTRPGGRIAILELAEPGEGLLGPATRFWVHAVVPRLGGWLSRAPEYRYLQQSIAAFPPPETFAATMAENGLAPRSVAPLGFGACTLFVAEVR